MESEGHRSRDSSRFWCHGCREPFEAVRSPSFSYRCPSCTSEFIELTLASPTPSPLGLRGPLPPAERLASDNSPSLRAPSPSSQDSALTVDIHSIQQVEERLR